MTSAINKLLPPSTVPLVQVDTGQIEPAWWNFFYTFATLSAVNLTAGEGIDIERTNSDLIISTELASDTNPGAATFDVTDFTVTSGNVTLKEDRIEDISAALLTNGVHNNIVATYEDGSNRVDLNVTGLMTSEIIEDTNLYFTDERVDDRVQNLLQSGDGVTLEYDDASDALTVVNSYGAVSVKDVAYGAVGDGSTDDTAAFQAALNTGKTVYIPPGSYNISSTLYFSISGTRLIGQNPNGALYTGCVLLYSGTGPVIQYTGVGVSTLNYCSLEKLEIYYPTASGTIIDMRSWTYSRIIDCIIFGQNVSGCIGIEMSAVTYGVTQCTNNIISGNIIANGGKGITMDLGCNANTVNDNAIQIGYSGGHAIYLNCAVFGQIHSNKFINNQIEYAGNVSNGITLNANAYDTVLIGNRFEALNTAITIGSTVSATTLIGNAFDGSTLTQIADSGVSTVILGRGYVQPTQIVDKNFNTILGFQQIPSSVNYLYCQNAAAGDSPALGVVGSSTNIGITAYTKGSGQFTLVCGNAAGTTTPFTIYPTGVGNFAQWSLPSLTGNRVYTFQDASGTLYQSSGTDVVVDDGGTGRSTATAYAPLCGGTTSTGAHQSATTGTSGQLFTSQGSSAVPSWVSGVTGTTTNDNAASGIVGEVVSTVVLNASRVNVSATTATDIMSISLTAGDWEVYGNLVCSSNNSATTMNAFQGWSSSSSATIADSSVRNIRVYGTSGNDIFNNNNIGMNIVTRRFSLSTTTTVYLTAYIDYVTGTCSCWGGLYARRVR
jgi:hypothetical protein